MKIHYQKHSSVKEHLRKYGGYTMNRTLLFLTNFSLGYVATILPLNPDSITRLLVLFLHQTLHQKNSK